ncbi:MAG: hypothetical protein V3U27_02600, partial [Candidatus Tectomicrobia bacterium]
PNGKDRPITWLVLSSEGEYMSAHEDPVDYCKAVRQLLEAISTRERLRAFWQRNLVTIAMLRRNLPDLKSDKGEHYADILTNLYKQQMRVVWEEAKADRQRTPRVIAEAGQDRDGGRVVTRVAAGVGEAMAKSAEVISEQSKGREHGRDNEARGDQETTKPPSGRNKKSGELDGNGLGARKTTQLPLEMPGGQEARSTGSTHNPKKPAWNDDKGDPDPSRVSRVGGQGQSAVRTTGARESATSGQVDKTNLSISTPRRIRNKGHLRHVASQPCLICGRAPSHAHHLRFAQPQALGRKVSDEWTVPLCATHHRAVHSVGTEEKWWQEKGLDPIAHAVRLWWGTRHGGVEHNARTTIERVAIDPVSANECCEDAAHL